MHPFLLIENSCSACISLLPRDYTYLAFSFFHALFGVLLFLILFTSSFLDEVRPPLTDSTESVKLSSRLTLTTGNTAAGAATVARKSQSAILLGQNNNHKKTGATTTTTATTNAAGLLNNEPLMTSIVSLVAQLQGEISARESARPRRSQSNTSQPEVCVRVYLDVHVESQ